jgi:predicted pyridoxine 5'-phosphate oxidase superfamily flavin-nucleotide-binding protein
LSANEDQKLSSWHDSLEDWVLCWLATVDEHGQPNVSPKEVFAVFDPQHLVIAHIASPISVRNIQHNPKVCVSMIDIFVQRGWKLQGHAQYVGASDAAFQTYALPLKALAGEKFKIHGVMLVRVEKVQRILAPSYRFYPDSTTEASQIASAMRAYGVRPVI